MSTQPVLLLQLLLRLAGGVMVLSFLAIFLPTEWMVASHRWLGLGPFPDSPLVQYLTRTASGLYTIHGALYLALSTDVRRYRPIIRLFSILNVGFGIMVTIVDLSAGLPLVWALAEGPPVVAFGLFLLWLIARIDREQP